MEVIGQVMDERTLKMAQYVNLGDDVGELYSVEALNRRHNSASPCADMKLADQVVQIWHDAKFKGVF